MSASASTQTITELDLSACHPSTIVDRINSVPGLKTSTGKSIALPSVPDRCGF